MTNPDAVATTTQSRPAPTRMHPQTALALVRIAAWAIALGALITGIALTVNRVAFADIGDGLLEPIDVWPAGLVLLGVGVLSIVALLIFECQQLAARAASVERDDPAEPPAPYHEAGSVESFRRTASSGE